MDIADVEEALSTRRGFAARVEPRRGLRSVAGFVAVLSLMAGAGTFFQSGGRDALLAMTYLLVAALAVLALGRLLEQLSLRPLRARYLDRGWVARQERCGLVEDSASEGRAILMRHLDPVDPRREPGRPVVLVGAAGQSARSVEAAAAAAREDLRGMTEDESFDFGQRLRNEALYRDCDAARFFSVPHGMSLTVEQGCSPFVLVIPASSRSGRGRARYYGLRGASA